MLASKKWKIRFPRRFQALFFVLMFGIILLCSSCGDNRTKDIQTLQAIYEKSNWDFRQSSANVQVYEKGTIQISIQGQATERSPGGDDFAWIPVALLEELPKYYGIEGDALDKYPGADLTAYQVKGGLWSIVALVPGMDKQTGETETPAAENNSTGSADGDLGASGEPQTRQIDLDVLMISPVFAESLPLYLPVGQGLASVKTSVELPAKAKFTSHLIKGGNESAEMIELPSSLSEGKVKALARLQPNLAKIWNFSEVKYRLPLSSLPLILSFIVGVGVCELFCQLYLQGMKNADKRVCDYLKPRLDMLLEQAREITESKFQRFIENSSKIFDDALEMAEKSLILKRVKEAIKEIKDKNKTGNIEDFEQTKKVLILKLNEALLRLNRSPEIERTKYDTRFLFSAPIRFTLYGIMLLFFFFLILPSVAQPGTPQASPSESFCLDKLSSTTLCLEEFSLTIPQPDIKKDEAIVKLEFKPIEADKDKKITIRFDSKGKSIEMDTKVNKKPSTLTIERVSSRVSKITNIPPNQLPPSLKKKLKSYQSFSEITAQSNNVGKTLPPVDGTQEYLDFLIDAKSVEIEYKIKGSINQEEQIVVPRINRTVNLFPFEKVSWKIPIEIDEVKSLISNFQLEEPASYNDSEVKLLLTTGEPFEKAIELQENKEKNKYVLKESSNYPILSPGQTLAIDGIFRHPDWGISFPVFWVIPLAIWVGAGLGIPVSRLPDGTPTQKFTKIGAFSAPWLLIAGIFWSLWKNVKSNYSQVSLFANVGFHSIFDYFMIVSIIIFTIIGVISCIYGKSTSWKWKLGIFFVLGIVAIFVELFIAFPFLKNLGT